MPPLAAELLVFLRRLLVLLGGQGRLYFAFLRGLGLAGLVTSHYRKRSKWLLCGGANRNLRTGRVNRPLAATSYVVSDGITQSVQ